MDKSEAENIAKKYIEVVTKKYPVAKAWLFGSYAKGSQNDDSDIDIAILLEHEYDIIDLQIELMKMRREIDLRIEPHPFTEEYIYGSSLFKNEIEKNGIEM
ncbi:MAG: nucleotidyltransferase domain-containing protein [Ginsengibacter sp.]